MITFKQINLSFGNTSNLIININNQNIKLCKIKNAEIKKKKTFQIYINIQNFM